ncbi:MAG: riboflavin synthase [Spirochaetota bacterium]
MFTGIIQEIGKVSKIKSDRGREITISAKKILQNIHYGDSIAVNGTCQTVTRFDENSFTFFSMEETLEITNLSALQVGNNVNLEASLTLNTLLGGHIIMGHIDGLGKIKSIVPQKNSTLYNIEVNEELSPYIVQKGSVAIDGISLTVYNIQGNIITVAVIPTTQKETILSQRKVGDKLNIETDLMAKYVEKLIFHNKNWNEITQNIKENKGLSEDTLKKYGFI